METGAAFLTVPEGYYLGTTAGHRYFGAGAGFAAGDRLHAIVVDESRFSELMMRQEELKTYPMGAVWDYYCLKEGVPVREEWFKEVEKYEEEVLSKRV